MAIENPAIELVLLCAGKEVGDREATGNNDGPEAEKFLKTVGLPAGNPWCAAFVQFGINASSQAKLVWDPENPAYCPSIYTWARGMGIIHKTPKRGDVFLYIEDGWALHTGFVTGVDADANRFTTIEGNTNPLGSAEGDGVYTRSRPNNGAYVFVRWADLISETAAPLVPTFALVVAGKTVADMPVSAGRSYVKLETFAKAFGLTLAWDQDKHKPRLNGQLVRADVEIIEGRAWARINELLPSLGIGYTVDLAKRSVVIS